MLTVRVNEPLFINTKNAIVRAIAIAMAQLIASVNGLEGDENDLRMYLVLVDNVN